MYKNYSDRVNVKIGAVHGGENFFKINTYNYRKLVPGFHPENGRDCRANLEGSTEGERGENFIMEETFQF